MGKRYNVGGAGLYDLSLGRARLADIVPAGGRKSCRAARRMELGPPDHILDMVVQTANSNRPHGDIAGGMGALTC